MGPVGEGVMGAEGMQKGCRAEMMLPCPRTTSLTEALGGCSAEEQKKGHNYRTIPPQLSSWQSAVQEPKVASRLGLIAIDRPDWRGVMHDPFLDSTTGTTPPIPLPVPSPQPAACSA